MTFNTFGNVTHAGRRRVKHTKPQTWECRCVEGRTTKYYRQNPGYLVNCLDCETRRPDDRRP